jgi:Mrp family chromosome partitioning ATPase
VAVVVFGSVRSCGVTTLALSLAATWPTGRRVLLVEADPAGGTLAAGSGWPTEPSLESLAAAARRGGQPGLVWEHCHELPGGAAVLAGPSSTDHARSALSMAGALFGRLGELDADVLVDCGRLDPGSAALVLWEQAERVVLVARPHLADLHALAGWLEAHPAGGHRVGLVTAGDGPYPDAEVAGALGVEVLARLPWDPDAASALVSVSASSRELRLAPLVRAARTLAERLATQPPGTARGPEPSSTEKVSGSGSLRIRMLRPWRTEPKAHSTNGNAPEEVSP